ncbi:MAG: D-lyxose/D-mannose family sugar isomerase [Clostridiales bacterium]|nr:D-lyxose/D-mannose family sugar isomerase [Clostridiales bacterium]
MKRSEINHAIREMEQMVRRCRFPLPPFCNFTPEEWKEKGHEYDEIRDNMLGWDISDCGLGRFEEIGFMLITLRNGNQHLGKYKKPYAEKLMYVREGQKAPMHFHWFKMEDIINRGGGNMLIRVFHSTENEELSDSDVTVEKDGKKEVVLAGTQVKLCPGESITIYPGLYHEFETEVGTGPVLLGEVSRCNDDERDNRFYDPSVGRFSTIEEDEAPYRLLCNEYPAAKGGYE